MNKRISIVVFAIICFSSFFISCKMSSNEYEKYKIDAVFSKGTDNTEFKKGGVNCTFYNFFPKGVKEFILVFSLFDESGEPVVTNIKYEIKCIDIAIKTNDNLSFCLNLDDILSSVNSEVKFVDFVYISKIIFDDGTEWSDPYGLKKLNK